MSTRAILIACKNGEATIGQAVAAAVTQADVYVVSDGSTDATGDVAVAAGAYVLELEESVGKPTALRAGMDAFDLAEQYEYIGVLDDDTLLAPDYCDKLVERIESDDDIVAASGRIHSLWDESRRWNVFVAMRAFTYWSYQVTIKRGQDWLHVVNVICGANTLFRAPVLKRLIDADAPYAIDDMYWVAEIATQQIGRVAYVHHADSWTIDPHTLKDWYRQTVRWSWGQFQSIRGHRLGSPIRRDRERRFGVRFSWFDTWYLALLVDWFPYMLEPLLIVPAVLLFGRWFDPMWLVAFYLGTFFVWITVAAWAMRKWRLLVLSPALIVLDLVYRVTMMHALWKAIRMPRVEACKWDSPPRFEITEPQTAAVPAAAAPPDLHAA